MDKFLQFRAEQEAILEGDDTKRLGDVTSVNMTMIGGGVQMNVIPEEATASFDIRITPGTDLEGFKTTLDAWTAEEGVSYELVRSSKLLRGCRPLGCLGTHRYAHPRCHPLVCSWW